MAYAIAIFVGGVLGAASEGGFGLFVGGLLGWLLVRVSRQQRDIAALRASLSAPRAADATPAGPAGAAAPQAAVLQQPVAAPNLAPSPALRAETVEAPLADATPAAAMSGNVDAAVPARPALKSGERAGPDTMPMPEEQVPQALQLQPAAPSPSRTAPLRDAQTMAGRRQHHRQGRCRDPLRRPRLPRQVRRRAYRRADGMAAGGDRRRRRGPARLRLAAAPVAARLCAGAAGRGGRGALSDFVRGVSLLRPARCQPGLRPHGRGRRAGGRARGAARRSLARRHRCARRLRHAADRLHRLRQRNRAVRLLPRARRRHRCGRVVPDLALAQPDRLLRHLPRRHRLGRAPLPAGVVCDERGLPDRLLSPVRAHHAAARATCGSRHRAPQRRLGQQHPAVRPANDRLRPAARAGAPHAIRHRALGAGDGRLLRPAGDDDEEARRARVALRCQPGDRHRLPDPGRSVRPRRTQHRGRLDARGCWPGVDRPSPGSGAAACLRLHPVRAGGPVDAVRA